MPLKRPKNAPRLWLPLLLVERLKVSLKTQRHGKIYFVVELQGTDTARPRQYSIVEKRQAYLELSYLCSTFVSLWKWQDKPTKARQGKCLRRHNHSPKFLVRCCQRREADLLGKARQGKNTAIQQLRTVHGSIWNCHTFVVPLCR